MPVNPFTPVEDRDSRAQYYTSPPPHPKNKTKNKKNKKHSRVSSRCGTVHVPLGASSPRTGQGPAGVRLRAVLHLAAHAPARPHASPCAAMFPCRLCGRRWIGGGWRGRAEDPAPPQAIAMASMVSPLATRRCTLSRSSSVAPSSDANLARIYWSDIDNRSDN